MRLEHLAECVVVGSPMQQTRLGASNVLPFVVSASALWGRAKARTTNAFGSLSTGELL